MLNEHLSLNNFANENVSFNDNIFFKNQNSDVLDDYDYSNNIFSKSMHEQSLDENYYKSNNNFNCKNNNKSTNNNNNNEYSTFNNNVITNNNYNNYNLNIINNNDNISFNKNDLTNKFNNNQYLTNRDSNLLSNKNSLNIKNNNNNNNLYPITNKINKKYSSSFLNDNYSENFDINHFSSTSSVFALSSLSSNNYNNLNTKDKLILNSTDLSSFQNTSSTYSSNKHKFKKNIFATYKADNTNINVKEVIDKCPQKFKTRRDFIKERNKLAARKSRSNKVAEYNRLYNLNKKLKEDIYEKDVEIKELKEENLALRNIKSKHSGISIASTNNLLRPTQNEEIKFGSEGIYCNKCYMSIFSIALVCVMVICLVFAVKPYIGKGTIIDSIDKLDEGNNKEELDHNKIDKSYIYDKNIAKQNAEEDNNDLSTEGQITENNQPVSSNISIISSDNEIDKDSEEVSYINELGNNSNLDTKIFDNNPYQDPQNKNILPNSIEEIDIVESDTDSNYISLDNTQIDDNVNIDRSDNSNNSEFIDTNEFKPSNYEEPDIIDSHNSITRNSTIHNNKEDKLIKYSFNNYNLNDNKGIANYDFNLVKELKIKNITNKYFSSSNLDTEIEEYNMVFDNNNKAYFSNNENNFIEYKSLEEENLADNKASFELDSLKIIDYNIDNNKNDKDTNNTTNENKNISLNNINNNHNSLSNSFKSKTNFKGVKFKFSYSSLYDINKYYILLVFLVILI